LIDAPGNEHWFGNNDLSCAASSATKAGATAIGGKTWIHPSGEADDPEITLK
tara:strand:+ start:662 stop:817 length:156 start_codon:yes stop_codon:yes gene_type:complete